MEATWQKRGFWISLIAVIVLILVAIGLKVVSPAGGDAAAALDADGFAPNKNLEQCAVKVLEGQGFAREDIAVGSEVDPSLDVSTTGDGRFGDRIETPQQAVDFFTSGTPQAEVALATGEAQGFTRDELLDPSNAISVQILVPFTWPSNTGFVNGTLQSFGSREDPAGTIGVLFIVGCDENGEVNEEAGGKILTFIVRGVCANPQFALPKPKPPVPPTTPPTEPPASCPIPPKPSGGPFEWDPVKCVWFKPGQSFDQQQNQGPHVQHPQDNTTAENNGVNTGTTPGAPATPPRQNPVLPAPAPNTPAPPPVSGGYDSGGGTGSSPGGSTTTPGGNTSTGPTQPSTPPADTGQGGNNGTDGDQSNGGGEITQPDW